MLFESKLRVLGGPGYLQLARVRAKQMYTAVGVYSSGPLPQVRPPPHFAEPPWKRVVFAQPPILLRTSSEGSGVRQSSARHFWYTPSQVYTSIWP